jgi:orotate phosphoribosyltransferase-like protein
MTKKTKRVVSQTQKETAKKAVAKYRHAMGKNQDPDNADLVERILMYRNSGMTGPQISRLLNVDRGTIYSCTCSVNVFLTPQELAEITLCAMSLGESNAQYLARCHAMYGVDYSQKNGEKKYIDEMLLIANGEDV